MNALTARALKRLARSESGASMVEFAIVAPVLILVMMGTIVLGQWMYFGILAANAARAGTDYGAQNLTTAYDSTGMQTAALQDGQKLSQFSASPSCYTILNGSKTTCPSLPATATPAPGSIYYVEVDTSGTFTPLVSYPGIPKSVKVGATSISRVVAQ